MTSIAHQTCTEETRLPKPLELPSPAPSTITQEVEPFYIAEELQNPGYAVPEVDVASFIKCILPPLKDGIDVEGILSSFEDDEPIGPGGQGDGHLFALFSDVFERVTSLASTSVPHLERIIEIAQTRKRPGTSRGRMSPSNHSFVLKAGEKCGTAGEGKRCGTYSWYDVALIAEFREGDIDEVRGHSTSSAVLDIQQVMARDPCRRFTFAISCEGTMMRLWFFPHGTPIVSKVFDFTVKLDLLAHVFLSLAFASKEELGWDPTILPVISRSMKRAYRINVGNEVYETTQALANSTAEELISHATRVWRVTRLDSDDAFVLKDVWLEDDRDLEHVIYDTILNDVEGKYGADIRREVATHLLTPVAHCIVPINNEEDHTTKVMMRGFTPSFKNKLKIKVEQLDDDSDDDEPDDDDDPQSGCMGTQNSERSNLRSPFPWCNSLKKVLRRRHYRIVFREVAQVLHSVRNLADVFTVLSDTIKALKWIHGCGWVHRDLSVSNLYLYDGRGLIGDLEYAKRRNRDITRELRTGTPDFTAVEAARRLYSHLPREDASQIDARMKAFLEDRIEELAQLEESLLSPPFFHNDLHDLESLWWVAIWKMFCNQVKCAEDFVGPQGRERSIQRERTADELFPANSTTGFRALFLQDQTMYFHTVGWMPERFRKVLVTLNAVRRSLVRHYRIFEAEFPAIRTDTFKGAHETFQRHFTRCKEYASNSSPSPYGLGTEQLNTSGGDANSYLPASSKHQLDDHAPSGAVTATLASEPMTPPADIAVPTLPECQTKKGKRKRENCDNGDTFRTDRPLRIPRRELQAC